MGETPMLRMKARQTRMSGIRFNHVWVGLVLLAFASAFFIPQKYTNKIRNVQGLFAPVASPTRKLALAIDRKIAKPETHDTRQLADIRAENEHLRTTLMGLNGQLDELKRINAERSKVGPLRDVSTPVKVVGSDTGTSESLSLAASTEVLMEKMPVVYSGGLLGRIDRTSRSGSQVQLVTDRSFRATAQFVYFQTNPDGSVKSEPRNTQQALAEGDGKGMLIVHRYPKTEADKIQIGDHLTLEDPEWPLIVQGQPLGQVIEKTERRDAALFFEIKLKPLRNLKEMPEVMVVTKN
jgi:cell shape-determining protein MreC